MTTYDRKLEMRIDGTWVDALGAGRVYGPASDPSPITINYGSEDEQIQASAGRLTADLDNRDLYFSGLSPGSANFGKLGRNVPVRYSVARDGDTGPATVTDTFTRSGFNWGTSDSGHQWAYLSTGLTTSAETGGSTGVHTLQNASSSAISILPSARFSDCELTASWSVVTPTGGNLEPTILLRGIDSGNYTMLRIEVSPTNTLALVIRLRCGGVERELTRVSITDRTYSSGATWRVHVYMEANRLAARVWDSALSEPTTWDLDAAECGRLGEGWVGIRSGVGSGVSSIPHTFTWDTLSVTPINGTYQRRFFGVVSKYAPTADKSNRDLRMKLEADGALQHLTQGAAALRSPLYRAYLAAENQSTLIGYWPVEDGSGATQIATASPGLTSGELSDSEEISFGSDNGMPGSDAFATLGTSSLTFDVPAFTSTESKVAMIWTIPDSEIANGATMLRVYYTGGTVSYIDLLYSTGGSVQLTLMRTSGSATSTAFLTLDMIGRTFYLTLEIRQDGADIDYTLAYIRPNAPTMVAGQHDGTFTGATATGISQVIVNRSGTATGAGFGQLAVGNDTSAFGNVQALSSSDSALIGHSAERAAVRFLRLCVEEGYSAEIIGAAEQSEQMGPQTSGALVTLLTECQKVDRGAMFESRGALGPAYRTRRDMYDQYPTVEASFGDADLFEIEAVYDDAKIWNDVTVARTGGSSARVTMDEGSMSVSQPPDGVGPYDRGVITIDAYEDDQLNQIAAWVRSIGTVDDYRYPRFGLHLTRDAWTSAPARVIAATDARIGDWLMLTDLPTWLPPNDVPLIVNGYREEASRHEWRVYFNMAQGMPWETTMMDAGTSTVTTDMDSDDTNLIVDMALGPAWSTDVPFLLEVSTGELVRVTTVTHQAISYVGEGTISHNNNASNAPTLPGSIQNGDLLVTHAGIRNSGTGTVNTPIGWTSLVANGNQALIGQYYASGTAPTITYANGVANATTTAQVFAWRNASMQFASGTLATPAAATQLNGSAANIATPALTVERANSLVVAAGWKQDDWTSVTGLAGFSEAQDDFSTLGDDQGMTLGYVIQTTATDIAASSFTVTGGASAISRSILAAFRPVQHLTVDRGVNGVTGSIPAGSTVTVWRLGSMEL